MKLEPKHIAARKAMRAISELLDSIPTMKEIIFEKLKFYYEVEKNKKREINFRKRKPARRAKRG